MLPAKPSLFVPIELVDEIVSHVTPDEDVYQKQYSTCALVSHSWSMLVRKHRYRTFQYRMDAVSRTFPSISRRNKNQEAYKMLDSLVHSLDIFPDVCDHIRNLHLGASTGLDFGKDANLLDSSTSFEDSGEEDNPHESQNGNPGFSLASLAEVLRRLTSLRTLKISSYIIDHLRLMDVVAPSAPYLERVEISRGNGYNGVLYIPGNKFRYFLSLFETIKHLSLLDSDISESDGIAPSTAVPLPTVKSLTLAIGTTALVLTTLIQLPSVSTITSLDLSYITSYTIANLNDLVNLCGHNLEYMAFQFQDHVPSIRRDPGPAHYLSLNLTPCTKLQTLSIKLPRYGHGSNQGIHYRHNTFALLSEVSDILTQFIENCLPPQLPCLDFRLRYYPVVAIRGDGETMSWQSLEDVLLPALKNGRMQAISVTPWPTEAAESKLFDEGEWWKAMTLFLPHLAREGLLHSGHGAQSPY